MPESDSITTDKQEEWRSVPEYKGFYSVSSLGRVRNDKGYRRWEAGRLLKPAPVNGYLNVQLCRNQRRRTFGIHQLVALAFIGPCPEGHNVNHKDTIKTNNVDTNLEYTTFADNSRHASANGLLAFGDRNHTFKLTESLRHRALEIASQGETQRVAARAVGISESRMSLLVRGLI